MKKIEVSAMQQLLDEIKSLENAIKTEGDEQRDKLNSINLTASRTGIPLTANDKVDPNGWSSLQENQQQQFYNRILAVKEALQAAAGLDGPKDPKHIMSSAYVSTKSIIVLALLSFSFALIIMYFIVNNWEKATGVELSSRIEKPMELVDQLDTLKQKSIRVLAQKEDLRVKFEHNDSTNSGFDSLKQAFLEILDSLDKKGDRYSDEQNETKEEINKAAIEMVESFRKGGAGETVILITVILFGMLGGMLHLIRSLVMFVGNRQLKRSWVLYYLSMPITGGGLAVIVYILLRVGLLNPAGTLESSTSNLNLVAVYAIAGLTGLFARTALDKLSEIFKTFFKTESSTKDSLETEKPPDKK